MNRADASVGNPPERAEPFCPYYGACGGCRFQHWRAEDYAAWKRGRVVEALRGRGLEAAVGRLVDAHGAGRRRVVLHVRRRKGSVSAGFMAHRSHDLLDIDACPILVPQLQKAPDIARAIGRLAGDCDVVLTSTLGGIDVAVKAARSFADEAAFRLLPLLGEFRLARLSLNGDMLATVSPPAIAFGSARVVPPPGAFLQATAAGEEAIAECVIGAAREWKTAADLFCGIGPFALRLAGLRRVTAFDADGAMISALEQAARATPGLKPLGAHRRNLFREPLTPAELGAFDGVVIDPPRAGAEAQARELARAPVRDVVMVSCDPATFARDAAILVAGGYVMGEVTPIDQFKWSAHVECAAVFQRSPLR